MAGFVLWERVSGREKKEVKSSEAHTYGSDGGAGYGGDVDG